MELQLLHDMQASQSVEDWIRQKVEGLEDGMRLETVMRFMGMAVDAEEFLQEAAVRAWELVEREKWWKAEYGSWQEFKNGCGLGESMVDVMQRRGTTERLKRRFEVEAAQVWGGREGLKDVLGEELMPKRAGVTFLEKMRKLSRELNDVEAARKLLIAKRNLRLRVRGSIKDERLQPRDVEAALKEVQVKRRRLMEAGTVELAPQQELETHLELESGLESEPRLDSERLESEPQPESEPQLESERLESGPQLESESRLESEQRLESKPQQKPHTETAPEMEMETESESESESEPELEECKCKNRKATDGLVSRVRRSGGGLQGKLEVLKGTNFKKICYRHLRNIASSLELQTSGMEEAELLRRMREVMGKTVGELWGEEWSREWFRKRGLPADAAADRMGPFKYSRIKEEAFEFDRVAVWRRYAGEGAMEAFFEDGNVIVKGVFYPP